MAKGDGDLVLVLVDESNVVSSVRTLGRGLDWLKLRDFIVGGKTGRTLIEMVVYAGLPPAIPLWQEERDKKNKFVHWLRSHGFLADRRRPLQGERRRDDGDRGRRAIESNAAGRDHSCHG